MEHLEQFIPGILGHEKKESYTFEKKLDYNGTCVLDDGGKFLANPHYLDGEEIYFNGS
jgi:hypothetical protein